MTLATGNVALKLAIEGSVDDALTRIAFIRKILLVQMKLVQQEDEILMGVLLIVSSE